MGPDLSVAVKPGDDPTARAPDLSPHEMFSDAPFPIAKTLWAGADIVIPGRCVGSAVACGGVASLRNDAFGTGIARILLQTPVTVPRSIVEAVS